MSDTVRYVIGAVWFFGILGFALWRGGRTERLAAGFMLAATLLTPVVARHVRLADPQWDIAIVDGLLLVGLLILTLRSQAVWLMAATAFQALNTFSHVALIFDARIGGLAYITSRVFWSYLVVAALLVGTIQVERRRRRYGRLHEFVGASSPSVDRSPAKAFRRSRRR